MNRGSLSESLHQNSCHLLKQSCELKQQRNTLKMLKTISFLCVIALAAASFLITEPIEGTRFLSPNNTMPCRFAGNVSMVPYAVTPGNL
jgi:hypothetical protein